VVVVAHLRVEAPVVTALLYRGQLCREAGPEHPQFSAVTAAATSISAGDPYCVPVNCPCSLTVTHHQ
jgi:hypothetical protein